jgi:hypothetical protein
MGKQSSRIVKLNSDHKDISNNGVGHFQLWHNGELLWQKISGSSEPEQRDYWSIKVKDQMIDQYGNARTENNGNIALNFSFARDESGSRIPIRIDWGDGTQEEFLEIARFEHQYPTNDGTEYEVKVYGTLGNFNASITYNGVYSSCITEIITPLPYIENVNSYGVLQINNFFSSSKSLTKICDNIFVNYRDFNGEVNAVGAFEGTNIEYVPDLIFSGLYKVDIAGVFQNCKNLKNISASCLLGTDYSRANQLFYGCSSLKSIPSTLFVDGFEEVENFDECFYECTSLVSVPETLFDGATNGNSFVRTFYGDSSIESKVPALWERTGAVGTGCYYLCGKAENYSEIPLSWQ